MTSRPAPTAAAGGVRTPRAALAAEVRRLEEALRAAQRDLVAHGGDALPGMHLLVEAAGRRALLPASRVSEVIRLVATAPLAGASPHVLGTFVCRGQPVVAVDLSAWLGAVREPPLDAQIAILPGSPTLGVVVDRVDRLVDGPRLFHGDAASGTPPAWRGTPLVAGLCLLDREVVPLLDPAPLAEGLPERP
ncbi:MULTISPECIES: chemotaxis protein CheW [unclassified Anaeromyxobacter]|uniref:chemotaxis protein CheW n=1 Tax=unclassified Anaeromyxobacter TaxID=2620896 RepID=UPI001F5A0060|nr:MULTISPECIES: chemotaxis protein CheW [unclassified Anaeromyxobacter]